MPIRRPSGSVMVKPVTRFIRTKVMLGPDCECRQETQAPQSKMDVALSVKRTDKIVWS